MRYFTFIPLFYPFFTETVGKSWEVLIYSTKFFKGVHIKAWIIIKETPNIGKPSLCVVGFISARKSFRAVKTILEWYVTNQESSPMAQLRSTRYNNPEIQHESTPFTSNKGVHHQVGMRCGGNPYYSAKLVTNIKLLEENYVEWVDPDRIIQGEDSSDITIVKGRLSRARFAIAPTLSLNLDIDLEL